MLSLYNVHIGFLEFWIKRCYSPAFAMLHLVALQLFRVFSHLVLASICGVDEGFIAEWTFVRSIAW